MPRLSSCLSSTTFPNLLSVSQQRNRRTCKCVLGLSRQYVLYSHYESTIYLSALPLVLLLTQPFAARSRHRVQSCVPNPPAVLALTHALSPPSARDACTPPTHRLSGRCGQPEGAPRRARRSAQMQTLSSEVRESTRAWCRWLAWLEVSLKSSSCMSSRRQTHDSAQVSRTAALSSASRLHQGANQRTVFAIRKLLRVYTDSTPHNNAEAGTRFRRSRGLVSLCRAGCHVRCEGGECAAALYGRLGARRQRRSILCT